MKKLLRKFKRANKVAKFLYTVIILGYIISFIFFAKSVISLTGIETIIRYVGLIICVIYFLYYVYSNFIRLINKKYLTFYIMSLFSILLIAGFSVGSYFIDVAYNEIGGFTERDEVTYTSYLITMKDTTLNAKSTLGMIDNPDDIEGYILAKDIIKKNKLKQKVESYEDYEPMLYDLYDGKVDGVFVSANYVTLYNDEEMFKNIGDDTKIVYKLSKKMKNTDSAIVSNKSLDEPITALILGVDSESDGLDANAAFNGDTLILATFNPHTFTATLFSMPRDIYVPIACRNNAYAKINSSAAYGTSCVIDTISQLTGIDIDYYVKINFKGVVELVDAVGGVEVDVEEPNYRINHGNDCGEYVCEQNSDRSWGSGTIYLTPGLQTLNGEEALSYARNRGQYIASDLARNRHQQDVILAVAKKAVKINSYNQFKNVLNSVSNNFATNMDRNQILSSYNIFKEMIANLMNGEEFVGIEKTYLETYSLPVYLAHAGRTTSALGYYEASLDEIIHAMKINLELEKPEFTKTFEFSMNEEYTSKVPGQGVQSGKTTSTLASLIGKTKSEAESYCSSNKIRCNFTYIDETSQYYKSDIEKDHIAYQNPLQGTLLKNASTLNLYIIGASASNKQSSSETSEKKDEIIKKDTPSKETEQTKDKEVIVEEEDDDTELIED